MREAAHVIVAIAFLTLTGCSSPGPIGPARTVQVAGASLPPIVVKTLNEYLAVCTEVGGKADASRGIHRQDLNGDGITDHVIDGHGITCDGAASVWGDRAKMVAVFISDGRGDATPAFSDMTWGMTIEGRGRLAKLWLGVSAEGCGKPPARDFASENFCDRAIVWDAASRTFDYAPVSTVRHLN